MINKIYTCYIKTGKANHIIEILNQSKPPKWAQFNSIQWPLIRLWKHLRLGGISTISWVSQHFRNNCTHYIVYYKEITHTYNDCNPALQMKHMLCNSHGKICSYRGCCSTKPSSLIRPIHYSLHWLQKLAQFRANGQKKITWSELADTLTKYKSN